MTSSWIRRSIPLTIDERLEVARTGDEKVLGRLLELYRGYLLSIANQEMGSDIVPKVAPSDLVQETFFQAYRDFPKFLGDSESELRDWLKAILVNNLRDTHRHYRDTQKRQVDLEQPWDVVQNEDRHVRSLSTNDSPSQFMQAADSMRALRCALSRLPEEYRQVIQRRNFDAVGFDALAKEFNRTPEAVRKLWGRAVRRLTEELTGDESD